MRSGLLVATGLTCALLLGNSNGALAQPREHRGGGWHGDMHAFHGRDMGRWHGGRWYHGNHGGHFGWWWIVGGAYYWYPAPIYPYPDPYTPPLYIERQPDAPVAATPLPGQPAPPPQSAAGTWYYCESAKTYYPYVADCPGGWRGVPATPSAPPR